MRSMKSAVAVGIALLVGAGVGLYYFAKYSANAGATQEAIKLSVVVLVGLALVVVLMAGLVIVYSVLGLANQTQALALPEGSVRALIAFSLVLVFVCMAAFLHNSVNSVELSPGGKTLTKITEAQLTDLRTQFVVAYEPARKTDGSVETDADGKSSLYNATYFSKRNKDADEFARQIFTTLATVFVSVVSFYFGSSTTSAGVGAGAKAAQGGDGTKKGDDAQTSFADAQTAAHDAQVAVDRTVVAVTSARSLVAQAPSDEKTAAEANVTAAQKLQDAATEIARQARAQVELARRAVADVAAAGVDLAKASAAAADGVKARDTARQLADKAKSNAGEAEKLLDKIRSDVSAA